MDHLKTKAQLIAELEVLRAQVATLTQVTEQSPSKPSLLVNYLSSRENGKSLQVLCVEDSEIDCNIYQRFLRQNQEYTYQFINFNLGEEALIWCQQNQPDILLLDYSLPDMDGLEFLIQFRTYWENHQCPALVITGQGNTEIAVEVFKQGAQDYLDKSQITADSLNRSVTHLVQKTQLLQEQQWQQQRQQLIAKTALSIRQSLNLAEILQTTVTEIRQILQSDRVIVYQFQPDRTGIILQESVCDPTLSLLGAVMPEEHFPYTWVTPYEQGRTRVIQDIYTDPDISDCHREFLEQLHIRSNLIVPLLLRDHLWGLLIAHHCTAPRSWTANEVNLMQELATQVSIAIQQATLLQELQQELLDRKQAEIALQHSQEQLKTAVESADLGTWCLDVAAQASTVSDRFKSIFGFPLTPGTVTFNSIIQRIHPDDRPLILEKMGQTIAHQQPYNAEYRIIWPDGTVRWILAKGKALCDQQGHVVMVAGCALDLTERKHLETQLQINEERLNLALDLTGIGCWDWNLQTQDIVWNDNHFRLLGLDPETAVSDYATWRKSLPPDDLETVEALLQQSIQTQEFYSAEYRIIWPDGSLHWVWGAGQILRDQPTRMLGVIKDITPRKQIEIDLLEREETLRLFVSYAPAGIAMLDENLHYVMASQRWIEDYQLESIESILGRSHYEIFPEIPERWKQVHRRCLAGSIEKSDEDLLVRSDGTQQWIRWEVRPWSNSQGEISGIIIFSEDITQRKQLEKSLKISEQRLRMTLELTEIGCWDWDLQSHQLTCSDNQLILWGLPLDSRVSDFEAWKTLLHPDDLPQIEHSLQNTLENHDIYTVEYRIYGLDGSLHWMLGRGYLLMDANGQSSHILGITLEITERKQAEIALHNLNTKLEEKVKQRTKRLTKINNRLQKELITREIIEKKLKKQEQLLQSFFDAASVANIGLGIGDHRFRFVQVNQAFADMNGYSIEAHLNHSVTEILPHLASSIQPLLQQVLETGEAISNREIAIALPQEPNVMRYWLVSYFPIPGNSKNQKAIGNIIIEISDRKRIEIEREKLIDILEVTSDIIATAAVNTLEVEYLNLSGRRVFGFPEQTPLDQLSIPDVHPPWAFSILRDQGIPTAIREGVWMGETAILKSDGEEIPVSQVILAHTFGTNQVQFISTIIRNITQQKQTEATLRESNRRWQSLLDNVQLIVVALNEEGQVEYINPFFLKLTGYSEAEVLGKMWFDHFIPPHQRLEVNKMFQDIIAADFHPYHQNSILTQSGEERIIAWNNTLLQNVEGQPIGTLSIGEDITERYQLERMKAEFISMVSHELRTPLTAMQAGLSLLHSNIIAPQSPEGQITLDIAMTGVNRLVRLVNDILDLERLESGKIRLAIRPCDVTILINTAIAQMQELANQGGIVLESQIQPFEIDADPDRLLQVLINLLSNAIKFSPNHSVIHLSVHLYQSSSDDEQPTINAHQASTSNKIYPPLTSEFLLFAIRDHGRGIPKENLESIFERFHQVDSSDSREKGGTGLGLAICRSIIQQHGGQIWVESRLQVGSTFYFTIPINYEASSYY